VLDLTGTVDLLTVLADPTRVRLLCLLEAGELSVAELTRITSLSQSRVSTHLARLRDAGLVHDRRVATSVFYSVRESTMAEDTGRIWALLRERIGDATLESDRRSRARVVRAREQQTAWPDAVAGRMERHYSPGRTWEATARGLLGLVRPGDVLDVGSGDGVIAHLLAPRAHSITCLDRSRKVIDAARRRLAHCENVRFAVGTMHELPFRDESFDQVLLFNVLTYSDDPPAALREAVRVLRAGGTLVLVTLLAHRHTEVAAAYDHANLGFEPDMLRAELERNGLEVELCDVTSRERRKPGFQVVSAFACRPSTPRGTAFPRRPPTAGHRR
jgi:ArsR family transcriptional regulator